MPANKSAVIRYRIIDGCLTNSLRRYPTVDFLREKIQEQIDERISVSMIRKDMAAMKKIYKAPLEYSRNEGGYYYSEPEFSIKEFPLTQDEVEALDFSTALLNQLKGTKLFSNYESAINKVIEGYRVSKALGKSEKEILQMEEPTSNKGNQWIQVLLRSIIYKEAVHVDYTRYGGKMKTHLLSPYLVKEYRNRWYVIGHSARSKCALVMALDRIQEITKTKEKYTSDTEFSSDNFFEYSFGITQVHNVKPVEVILSFTPYQAPYILSQKLHRSQKELINDGIELRISLLVYETVELVMTVLGYGKEVKVIAPQSLRTKVRETAAAVMALSQDPIDKIEVQQLEQ